MRLPRLWAGLLLAAAAAPASAQPAAYKAVITAAEVEVRSGPGREFPPTGRLARGTEVTVERDEAGWLAVVPPPGSKSFVADRFLQFPPLPPGAPPVAIVLGDQVPVRPGNEKNTEPVPVQRFNLPRGTQVLLAGQKVSADGTAWWPIEPTARDVRYIPNDAILPPGGGEVASRPAVFPGGAAGDPRFAQAEQAERAGNFGTARDLYGRVADDADRDLAARARDRIAALEGRMRAAAVPVSATAVSASRPTESAAGSAGRLLPPTFGPAAATPAPPVLSIPANPSSQTGTISGWLRRTGFRIDGRPTYALENSQGAFLRWYVTPQPSVNLEPYVNRAVELSGPLVYRGDVRSNYMVVNQVNLLR